MKKKVVAVVLLVSMLASITACGKNEEGGSGSGGGGASGTGNNTSGTMSEEARQYVFKDEVTPLRGDEGLNEIYQMVYDGTHLYAYGSVENEEQHLSYSKLYQLSTSGEVLEVFDMPIPEGKHATYSDLQPCRHGGVIAKKITYDLLTREEAKARQEEMEAMEASDDAASASTEAEAEDTAAETEDAGTETDAAETATGADTQPADPAAEDPEKPAEDEEWFDPLDYSSQKTTIVKINPFGEVVLEIEPELPVDSEGTQVSVDAMKVIHDGDQELVFVLDGWQGMRLYDANSTDLVRIIKEGKDPYTSEEYTWMEVMAFQDEIYSMIWGTNAEGMEARVAKKLNLETGEPEGEELVIPSGAYDMIPSVEESAFDFYQMENGNLYGFNFGDNELTKIMDMIDSDIDADTVSGTVILNEKELYALYFRDNERERSLAHLTKVEPEDVKEKAVLTLGGMWLNSDMRRFVIQFNKENENCRIRFVDYSRLNNESNAWEGGMSQLNADIIAGNTPDILILDNSLMPVQSYIMKGVFEDLNPFLNEDPEVKRTDLLENVLDALEVNGGLYQIGPSINLMTVIGRKSDMAGIDGNWTMEDCMRIIDKNGGDYVRAFGSTNTRQDLFNTAMRLCGNAFIDWEKQECYYNTDAFTSLLEFAAKFPVEAPEDIWMEMSSSDYRKGKSHFVSQMIYTYDMYGEQKYGVFGEDIEFVGFPYDGQKNYASITMDLQLAMSASCKHKEDAWQYIRKFFLPEHQDSIRYAYPMRLDSLEKMGQRAMERAYYEDTATGEREYYDRSYYLDEQEIKLPNLTQEDVDAVTEAVRSVNYMQYTDAQVLTIIEEETAAFFSGQKTAKEVADIIQNRVRMYVGEVS